MQNLSFNFDPNIPNSKSFLFQNASEAVRWCKERVCDVVLSTSQKEKVLWVAVGALFFIIIMQWLKYRMFKKQVEQREDSRHE